MINILIVDDHAIVRRGIKEIAEEIPQMAMVDEAENGRQALKKIAASSYDLVLLDIAMPGENGLEILRQIKKVKPETLVIILSMYSDENYVFRAWKAGADGYVTKDNTPDDLVDAITKVMQGESYISPSLQGATDETMESQSKALIHEGLSNREFQITTMIASGKSVTEIAKELCLSVKTISTHRANILKKMKMKNNAEITHYVINEGLIK